MFEWLEQEIATIKTPRFHMVEGPVGARFHEAVVRSDRQVPSSYKEFVLKFGNTKLYRMSQSNSYRIGVFAAPRETVLGDGTCVYHLGFHDGASVYVKPLVDSDELPIFEFEGGHEEKAANNFEDWLRGSCDNARRAYGVEKWSEILRGPKPFSTKEKETIEARRQMRWTVLGIDPDGNHIFEVTNVGRRTLDVLTVGVRSKDGRLNGAVRLNVRDVDPGQTAVLHVSCYKDLVPPQKIEVFALPDPEPEDRDFYWEFCNRTARANHGTGRAK